MAEFKIGDVVSLKSGGPRMTVSYVSDREVSCAWFNQESSKFDVQHASFKMDMVKAAVSSSS